MTLQIIATALCHTDSYTLDGHGTQCGQPEKCLSLYELGPERWS